MKDRNTETTDTGKGETKDTRDGDHVIDIECGLNKAVLHLDRLCQGSKGACILFEETWMTPNEFQAASGRETAKDWKRSIKHYDKSLKLLMVKGLFSTEPAACGCDYCTGTEPLPPPPSSPQTTSVTKETRKKRPPADTDDSKGALREPARRGRKKRKRGRPAAPLARQLRRRPAPISRRTVTRASPRTATRVSSRAGRRLVDVTSHGNKESSESDSEESDSESKKKAESSSDEAEESLPLADVRKGLTAAKGKKAAPVCDGAAHAEAGKRKVGRKAATKGDDASTRANDVTSNVGTGVKRNSAPNNIEQPKACERKHVEAVEGDSAVESATTDCANIGKAAQDASERLDVSKKSSLSETDDANESTSQIDVRNSKTLKIEAENAPPVESEPTLTSNGTNSLTFGQSRDENGVPVPIEQPSTETDIVKAEKGQARIGCSAPEEIVPESPAAAPQANKRMEDSEPTNGNTPLATSAAIPTPNDADRAIDIKDGNARSNATLPKDERDVTANNNLESTEDRTRSSAGDVTGQDGADGEGELLSPKREARLLSIIQELKTYKKRLVTKIEAKKRTSVAGQSPLRDVDSPCPSDVTKEEAADTHDCAPTTRDPTSQDTQPVSSSPLQQLLFDPGVHPLSSVAQPMTGTTSRVPGKRRRNATRRQTPYVTPGEGLMTAWSTALNHATKLNGVTTDGPPTAVVAYCFDSPVSTAGATGAGRSAVSSGRHPQLAAAPGYGVADRGGDDKCLLKVPKRCNTNTALGLVSDRSAKVPLLDLSAQKRKSLPALPEVAAKKQRGSWPIPMLGNVNVNMNSTHSSFVTPGTSVPRTSVVSLCDVSRTGRTPTAPVPRVTAAVHGPKSSRRPHISSWTADDVFAFVLSTPHASIYAKEFLELRITGRVLQNLTAIQMMRILRIGEHAARAVRATVEKLLEVTPAVTQGMRR